MRGKSLLSNERNPRCFVCGTTLNLHVHHVYGGVGRRPVSDEEGCWVYLCGRHHNQSNEGVHFNKKMDAFFKATCQMRWEQRECIDDPEHSEFIARFGRNYL